MLSPFDIWSPIVLRGPGQGGAARVRGFFLFFLFCKLFFASGIGHRASRIGLRASGGGGVRAALRFGNFRVFRGRRAFRLLRRCCSTGRTSSSTAPPSGANSGGDTGRAGEPAPAPRPNKKRGGGISAGHTGQSGHIGHSGTSGITGTSGIAGSRCRWCPRPAQTEIELRHSYDRGNLYIRGFRGSPPLPSRPAPRSMQLPHVGNIFLVSVVVVVVVVRGVRDSIYQIPDYDPESTRPNTIGFTTLPQFASGYHPNRDRAPVPSRVSKWNVPLVPLINVGKQVIQVPKERRKTVLNA